MNKISPCLWFDTQAEEAAKFYTSVFKGKITKITRYGREGQEVHGGKEGAVLTVEFQINGTKFTALNGGPIFKLSEAVSFQVFCETQKELDYYWDKLGEGGDPNAQQCGWLKDKYGLSWQIIPTIMNQFVKGKDGKYPDPVMKVLLQMKKLDIKTFKAALKEAKSAAR